MFFAGFRVIFWVVAIVCIIYLVRYFRMKGYHETPLDILKKRYARGTITKEEYERMKEELKE
jgi:putative membrane protein